MGTAGGAVGELVLAMEGSGDLADALHGRGELAWLHQAIVGTPSQGQLRGTASGQGGEHHHLGTSGGIERSQNIQTIHVREDQIQHQDIRLAGADQLHCALAVVGGPHDLHISLFAQSLNQRVAKNHVRVGNQNTLFAFHVDSLSSRTPCSLICGQPFGCAMTIIYHNQTANATLFFQVMGKYFCSAV